MPLFSRIRKSKVNILALDLSLTNLESGKGNQQNGRYCPFVQITDVRGRVIGRSIVLFDCCVSARWPPMKLNWDNMIQRQTSKPGAAEGAPVKKKRLIFRKKKNPIESSDKAIVEEVAMNQPLLLTVYDYGKDGQHAIIGKINTTIRELKAKAQHSDAAEDHSIGGKSSATEKGFQFSGKSAAKLNVKRIHSTQGKPDPLLQNNFADSKLKHVPAPSGIQASQTTTSQVDRAIRNGESLSSFDETLPTDCSSRHDDLTSSSWLASPQSNSGRLLELQLQHAIEAIEVPSLGNNDEDSVSESSWLQCPRVGHPDGVKHPQHHSIKHNHFPGNERHSQGPVARRPGIVKQPQQATNKKKASMRSRTESFGMSPLLNEMKRKLRRLAELRAMSELGSLPPTEAQEFEVLTRLVERFETQAKEKQQAVRRHRDQLKARKVTISPSKERKDKLKRMEDVLHLLASQCAAQGKRNEFKAYLVLVERLEKEAMETTPKQLQQESVKIRQGALLSKSLDRRIKTKLGQLERLKTLSVREFSKEDDHDDSTAGASLLLEEQVAQLKSLSQRLESHELGLHVSLQRQQSAQQLQQVPRRESISDILTESMKAKLRSMEATIQTICDLECPVEEAKYVVMFIKLLNSWDEEDESEEEEKTKQEQAKAMQGEGLNLSLIDGLSAKLQQLKPTSAPSSDDESYSDSDEEDAQDEVEPVTQNKEAEESQADVLARVLQRLEGHEARRRSDVQRLELERIQRSHPTLLKGDSSTPTTVACF